jgi:hypothetical protein
MLLDRLLEEVADGAFPQAVCETFSSDTQGLKYIC